MCPFEGLDVKLRALLSLMEESSGSRSSHLSVMLINVLRAPESRFGGNDEEKIPGSTRNGTQVYRVSQHTD